MPKEEITMKTKPGTTQSNCASNLMFSHLSRQVEETTELTAPRAYLTVKRFAGSDGHETWRH